MIHAATSLGYGALELRLLDGAVIDPVADSRKVEKAVRLARDAGIDVCALESSCHLNQLDSRAHEAQVKELRRWIALAGELKVPVVRVFGGPDAPGRSIDEGNRAVAEALAAVA